MAVRVLHCSISKENYQICATEKIVGFTKAKPLNGDIVYLAVSNNKETVCGARGIIGNSSQRRPWKFSDDYPNVFDLTTVEYCKPFKIKALSTIGGRYWHLRYLQGAKEIKDEQAIILLERMFLENKTDHYQPLD